MIEDPQTLVFWTQVLSPAQNLKPEGHVMAIGQFLTEDLHEPSMHFTGLVFGQIV